MTSRLFSADPAFEFETRNLLGNVHHGCGDVGEVLATVVAIAAADSSWVTHYKSDSPTFRGNLTPQRPRTNLVSAGRWHARPELTVNASPGRGARRTSRTYAVGLRAARQPGASRGRGSA